MMTRYTLPELPYDHTALEPHYSARLLELHHDKHHAAYVTGANATLEKLAQARDQGDFAAINQLQKSLSFHLPANVLHSVFWRSMTPRGVGAPDGELGRGIVKFLGFFAGMRREVSYRSCRGSQLSPSSSTTASRSSGPPASPRSPSR